MISNGFTNRLVHKWRTEETAILVGTTTALEDDPSLTARFWPGRSPVRMVIDMELKLPASLALFNDQAHTIIFNLHKHSLPVINGAAVLREKPGLHYYQVTSSDSVVHQVLNAMYQLNLQSLMVEGGAQLLQSFIDEGEWDEARVITNQSLIIGEGLPAPVLANNLLVNVEQVFSDHIQYFRNNKSA
jgi:diaminohydroxyphosphoribosylaminopyrimidine deaminase/5-amino-6-(5-phosphoribosylamino)uracil reductase